MIVLMPSLEADHRLPLSGDVLSQVNQPAAIYASYIGGDCPLNGGSGTGLTERKGNESDHGDD